MNPDPEEPDIILFVPLSPRSGSELEAAPPAPTVIVNVAPACKETAVPPKLVNKPPAPPPPALAFPPDPPPATIKYSAS